MNRYIIRNCPSCYLCSNKYVCDENNDKYCKDITNCVMKQIVKLCRKQKVINCNIDGKEQVLKAYYHTHLGDKILELLDIEEIK